ncbi:hypothetical protein [Epilithonimonas xixisoli]|uniref:Uncharacterized protein n=1 Tax=Epilithonimonas xixisoli TaxID=1476462 RepID=A0A4R8IDU3_9FLAO|nr:hypothetical protein [Epilithonimonas xixisoli]TDX83231.1 hypothetical protein B0I22_3309 [Epilithonimonas xixisoli]
MKKLILIIFLSLSVTNVRAQVAIGKSTITNGSVLLEFDNAVTNKKGIILSSVENLTNALASTPSANNGTFLFDRSDDTVKMYENNSWVNLSNSGSEAKITPNTSGETSQTQGAIIGAATSNAKGVLVLEATNKAMVLPWIQNPHINVKDPYPGMICYDTASRSLAVFDGSVWNYWK